MRIIAGKAGRLAIKVPSAVARPTTDFVRQAIYSKLGDWIVNKKVLDLFAGSGAVGLEALSRGASSVVFVDEHRQAIQVITDNLQKTKLADGKVVQSEVRSFLKRDQAQYDLIFADPPYVKTDRDLDLVQQLLDDEHFQAKLQMDGFFIAEICTSQRVPSGLHWLLIDQRAYGSSTVLWYQKVS